MLKVEVVLDEEKILREGKYTPEKLWSTVDKMYVGNGMLKLSKGVYRDAGRDCDWAVFGRINIALEQCSWFMENVKSWLWYNSDNGKDEDDFTIEDIIFEFSEYNRKHAK